MGSLDKGWKELSFMLSKRCYVATVNYHSKYLRTFLMISKALNEGWWPSEVTMAGPKATAGLDLLRSMTKV